MFFFEYWWKAFLDGLKLFQAMSSVPVHPPVHPAAPFRAMSRPASKGSVIRKPPRVKSVVKKQPRAPHGERALVVHAMRQEKPSTSGRGRRNGSR